MKLQERTDEFSVKGAYDLDGVKKNITLQLEGQSTKKCGYCARVHDISVLQTKASIKGTLLCTARVLMETVNLAENMVVSARVKKLSGTAGLFCEYEGCDILVPYTRLKDHDFRDGVCWTPRGTSIEIGAVLNIRVVKTRFQNGKYGAIGELADS